MSDRCDQPGEMPGDAFPDGSDLLHGDDDKAIEALLSGRGPVEEGLEPLAAFAQDVRSVTERRPPRPNASLAAVLSSGFSTEKGDLLVTAGSNVIGPAKTQAAGLPKWRNRNSMFPTGILSGLAAKVVAGVVSGLAGVTGLGVAGALPGPAQDAVATVIDTVTPFNVPGGGAEGAASLTSLPVPGVDVGVQVGGGGGPTTTANVSGSASVGASGANASASAAAKTGAGVPTGNANASAGGTAGVTTPTIPNLPGLPDLGNLPVQIPSCVKDIVDVKTGQPKVPLSQISSQVVNCVKTLMTTSGVPLPAGISQCVDSILGMVATAAPGSVPNISGLDVSKCVPVDVTKCMSSVMGMFKNLPGLGGGTGTGGLPFANMGSFDLSGCLPFNLDACLSSLLGMAGNLPGTNTGGIPGLGAGTIPSLGSLNLAACVPFGSLDSIPGMGFFSSFLPR